MSPQPEQQSVVNAARLGSKRQLSHRGWSYLYEVGVPRITTDVQVIVTKLLSR